MSGSKKIFNIVIILMHIMYPRIKLTMKFFRRLSLNIHLAFGTVYPHYNIYLNL